MPKQGRLSTERHKRETGSKRARRLVGAESGDSESHKPAEKPISLRPLEFEEAVRDLLRVKPDGKKSRLKSNVAVNAAQCRESN